jgi:hypothetical protein
MQIRCMNTGSVALSTFTLCRAWHYPPSMLPEPYRDRIFSVGFTGAAITADFFGRQ